MKKISSVGYAHKVLASAFVLLLTAGVTRVLFQQFRFPFLRLTAALCALAGIAILIAFGVLLAVALHQDRRADFLYRQLRLRKLPLAGGRFECQTCGSREVDAQDTHCAACGVHFAEEPKL